MNPRKISTESAALRYIEKKSFKNAATLDLFAQKEIIPQHVEEESLFLVKPQEKKHKKLSIKQQFLKEHFKSLYKTKKWYRRIRHRNYRKFFFPKITYKRFEGIKKSKLILNLCKKNKIAALYKKIGFEFKK